MRSNELPLDLVLALDFGADERRIENHLSAAGRPVVKPPYEQSSFRVAVCDSECRPATTVDVAISRAITAALDRSFSTTKYRYPAALTTSAALNIA